MGFNCLNATKPLRASSLLFTTKFPEISGTDFIDLGRMKGWVRLGAAQWFGLFLCLFTSSTPLTHFFPYLLFIFLIFCFFFHQLLHRELPGLCRELTNQGYADLGLNFFQVIRRKKSEKLPRLPKLPTTRLPTSPI